jgi:glutaminase
MIFYLKKLVETFNFHCFDVDKTTKIDPTKRIVETKGSNTIVLKFSAAAGDLDSIFRLHLCGIDMGMCDCDGRTALHVAACEGHYDICEYLLRQCGVQHNTFDR